VEENLPSTQAKYFTVGIAVIERALRTAALATIFIAGLSACQEGSSMGIKASKLDTSRYFPDPKVAAFVADVQDGNLKRVTDALKAGMNPNIAGKEGIRPLFFIFPASTADVTRALLAAGADPNVRLSDGNTPLYFAVRMENAEFTKALLEWKADPNALVEHDKPIIHEAVRSGQPEQIKLLARAGADINVVWSDTPLDAAIGAMAWRMAATLLDLGADALRRSPGGLTQYTAGESFCWMLTRANNPLRATPTNHQAVSELFAAFARRGVVLPCASEAARFR
jgi:hypothetical protein